MAHEEARYVRGVLPYPAAPTITLYSPSTTAYVKVTPSATTLLTKVAPTVTTETLTYASLITHKIADATGIAAADADDLAKSKTLVDEILAEAAVHLASTAIHVAAGTAIVPGHNTDDGTNVSTAANMSDLGTGYTLADELEADIIAHAASTTFHLVAQTVADMGGTPNSEGTLVTKANLIRTAMVSHFSNLVAQAHSLDDEINAALVTATTAATNQASAQTLLNLLKAYWNSHCAIGDATADDLAAVVVHANAINVALLAHYADATIAHGGRADATNLATLAAVAPATDQDTANTLLNAEKATLNLHYAVVDNSIYMTAGTNVMPLEWPSAGPFWCKTNVSGHTFATAEYKA